MLPSIYEAFVYLLKYETIKRFIEIVLIQLLIISIIMWIKFKVHIAILLKMQDMSHNVLYYCFFSLFKIKQLEVNCSDVHDKFHFINYGIRNQVIQKYYQKNQYIKRFI